MALNIYGTGYQYIPPAAPALGQLESDYYKSALTNYPGMGVIGSELKGEIPQDALSQIYQRAAERGVATGTVGSPNAESAALRLVGRTSLDQQAAGLSHLAQAYGTVPSLNPLGPGAELQAQQRIQQTGDIAAMNAGQRSQELQMQRDLAAQRQANLEAANAQKSESNAAYMRILNDFYKKYGMDDGTGFDGTTGTESTGWGVTYDPYGNPTTSGTVPASAWSDIASESNRIWDTGLASENPELMYGPTFYQETAYPESVQPAVTYDMYYPDDYEGQYFNDAFYYS